MCLANSRNILTAHTTLFTVHMVVNIVRVWTVMWTVFTESAPVLIPDISLASSAVWTRSPEFTDLGIKWSKYINFNRIVKFAHN